MWVGTGVCIVAYALRLSIRLLAFRRLFVEDSLMLLSLLTVVAIAAVLQHTLADTYLMLHVENGAGGCRAWTSPPAWWRASAGSASCCS
ncbi:hypothetical protein PG996_008360 [Apiospora saccharicola]|uniref:Uncharacterized protein n=1 Tax=Apiospora saccharicola TaxID=335842 RepID=A0ABR1V0Y0_9PEZI